MTSPRPLRLVGAATSAGAYGPGQERAPATFRRHGLVEALDATGRVVTDIGDVAAAVFRPDPDHPHGANVEIVVQVCRAVARSVAQTLDQGAVALVLGGDCTISLGTVAGALEGSDSVGLVYIDGDTDLNTPITGDGILDWMGAGHLLGLPGAERDLSTLARRSPMLEPAALRFVAADNANAAEQGVVDELQLHRYPVATCQAEPQFVLESLATWAADFDRLLVHVDIDVLAGADFPMADNTRDVPGLSLPVLTELLDGLCHLPNFAALTLCEVNPDHARDEAAQVADLISTLATALRPRDPFDRMGDHG